jgi:hypothetical protein
MNYLSVEGANRGRIIALPVPGVETRNRRVEFRLPRKLPEIAAVAAGLFPEHCQHACIGNRSRRWRVRTITSKELSMRNRILALAALAAAIGSPLAAQAQTSVTVGRAPAVVDSGPTIAVEQRPAFRDYVVEQRVPVFSIPDRVVVGTTLP